MSDTVEPVAVISLQSPSAARHRGPNVTFKIQDHHDAILAALCRLFGNVDIKGFFRQVIIRPGFGGFQREPLRNFRRLAQRTAIRQGHQESSRLAGDILDGYRR